MQRVRQEHAQLVRRQRGVRSTASGADGAGDGDPLQTIIDSALPTTATTASTSTTTTSTVPRPDPLTSTTSTTSTTIVDPITTTSSTTLAPISTSTAIVVASSTTPLSSSIRRSTVTVAPPSTNLIINSVTQSYSASIADSSTTSKPAANGPGAGTVVGIVAGGLVAIVVLSGFIGYFFKAKFGKDKDEDFDDAVFNRRSFRRESQMLPDDDAMSMRSGSAAGTLSALGRNNQGLPGMARNGTGKPRPPSMLERHYMNASPATPSFPPTSMPSFQPGQIINAGYYAGNGMPQHAGYMPEHGGYAYGNNLYPNQAAAQQQYYMNGSAGLDRSNTSASYYPEEQRAPSAQSQYADLHRQASQASQYTGDYHQQASNSYPPQPHGRQADPFASDRPLSEIREDEDAEYAQRPASPQEIPNGMYFHQQSNSVASVQQGTPGNGTRAQKTLSIRNGGLDEYYSGSHKDGDAYGGI